MTDFSEEERVRPLKGSEGLGSSERRDDSSLDTYRLQSFKTT
jgi:hypothetical protein